LSSKTSLGTLLKGGNVAEVPISRPDAANCLGKLDEAFSEPTRLGVVSRSETCAFAGSHSSTNLGAGDPLYGTAGRLSLDNREPKKSRLVLEVLLPALDAAA
jgi:hypothetical protein